MVHSVKIVSMRAVNACRTHPVIMNTETVLMVVTLDFTDLPAEKVRRPYKQELVMSLLVFYMSNVKSTKSDDNFNVIDGYTRHGFY